MNRETRNCQNCKNEFVIEPEDFEFYSKIKVPPPTWCPECRMQRRLCFRNERILYKRLENIHNNQVVSSYSSEVMAPIYNQKDWWSDIWDPLAYGKDYDFTKPFFEQFKALARKIPWPALLNWNSVNSDYCSYTTDNKNCYLVFGGDYNEDCSYATHNFYTKESLDLYWVEKCELCYELIYCENCYRLFNSQYCKNCTGSAYLFNCTNCHDCFGCINLKNRSHCILNKQYSKEEYEEKLKELKLGDREHRKKFEKDFEELTLRHPFRYARIFKSVNCTGNNISNSKNCIECFDTYENAEDLKNIVIAGWGLKDARSGSHNGHKSELIYESIIVFDQSSNVRFSVAISTSQHITYSWNCRSSHDLFGCVGLNSKEYCILNKQYSKEEYEKLVPKIIAHMDEFLFTSRSGYAYRFGDFLPPEISLFCYNETLAQEYFPLSKGAALTKGFDWREGESKDSCASLLSAKIPLNIDQVQDSILDETLECAHLGRCNDQCSIAFRIISSELEFYKKNGVPLPTLCPNCRHYERARKRNPFKLWHRKCQCAGQKSSNGVYSNTASHSHSSNPCPTEFETSYAPERPEIIYCEQCYQAEVV